MRKTNGAGITEVVVRCAMVHPSRDLVPAKMILNPDCDWLGMSDPVTDDTLAGYISYQWPYSWSGSAPQTPSVSVTTDDGMEPVITGCC